MSELPLSEQHEHYAKEFMTEVWEAVGRSQSKLSAHDILGILESVQMKIGFDLNVRAAQSELEARRRQVQDDGRNNNDGPSPIIDKHGFPVE